MSCRNCSCCAPAGYTAIASRLRELSALATLVGNGTLAPAAASVAGNMLGNDLITGPKAATSLASDFVVSFSDSAFNVSSDIIISDMSACVRLPCGDVRPIIVNTGNSIAAMTSTDGADYCLRALQLDELASNVEQIC